MSRRDTQEANQSVEGSIPSGRAFPCGIRAATFRIGQVRQLVHGSPPGAPDGHRLIDRGPYSVASEPHARRLCSVLPRETGKQRGLQMTTLLLLVILGGVGYLVFRPVGSRTCVRFHHLPHTLRCRMT